MNSKLLPSSTLLAAGVSVYVGSGVRLVSVIVIVPLVASTVPLVLPTRKATVNVSDPSVVASAVGVIENDPLLSSTLTVPLVVAQSPRLSSIVQYKVVLPILVPPTLNVKLAPSSTVLASGVSVYVGDGAPPPLDAMAPITVSIILIANP